MGTMGWSAVDFPDHTHLLFRLSSIGQLCMYIMEDNTFAYCMTLSFILTSLQSIIERT